MTLTATSEPISSDSASSSFVQEVTAATFMQEVIEASLHVPVLAYFTAPWCGPCKQFGPLLEKVVNDAKGRLKLAKIDVDKEPQIAQQFRIQSVPMVYIFVQGQPADGFSGAMPEGQLKQLLAQFITASPEEEDAKAILAGAIELLAAGDAEQAAECYQALLHMDKDNVDATAGLASCYIALKQTDKAQALLNSIPEDKANNEAVITAKAALSLALSAAESGDTNELRGKIKNNPEDYASRFALSNLLFASGKQEEAIEELLTIIAKEKDWNEGAARKQLLTIFEALGFSNPLAQAGRRKLSAILFK